MRGDGNEGTLSEVFERTTEGTSSDEEMMNEDEGGDASGGSEEGESVEEDEESEEEVLGENDSLRDFIEFDEE